jgi:SAM-dependent methyltransferase
MSYVRDGVNINHIFKHSRNKNFAVFPRRITLPCRIWTRLLDAVTRRHRSTLAGNFMVVVSEQVVENAYILRSLRPGDRTVLDFGAYESMMPLQLSALGMDVTVWDQRPYPFVHPNLKVVTADLFAADLDLGQQYDVVISVSTLEHLGLGRYNDRIVEDADARGAAALWRFVRPGGRLLASVPAGRPAVQRGYRVYDEDRLRRTFPMATSIDWFGKEGREGPWHPTASEQVRDLIYGEPNAPVPVEAVALVTCSKPE